MSHLGWSYFEENKKEKEVKTTFVMYPIYTCGCSNPQIMTSNDGNRHQSCQSCGWDWNAPH